MINPKELSIKELKACYYAYRKFLRDNDEWRAKHKERKRNQRASQRSQKINKQFNLGREGSE